METAAKKYRGFEELDVYQAAREFRKKMYDVTRHLPDTEKYGLAGQIRRAAVSLTNNIAEGHGRFHYLDNIKFVLVSRGSLCELVDDLNTCEDERYLSQDEVAAFKHEAERLMQLMNGYIRYLRDQKAGAALQIHEDAAPYGSECAELPE